MRLSEDYKLVATYKRFEKGSNGKWQVSSIKCYTEGFHFVVIVSIYGSRHCHEHVFTNKSNANNYVKDYINRGFKKVS